MISPQPDHRSPKRKALDEQIVAEPPLEPPFLPKDTQPAPMEAHRALLRHPVAVPGIVENGVVRPLDPNVKLTEHARVIIVASENQ